MVSYQRAISSGRTDSVWGAESAPNFLPELKAINVLALNLQQGPQRNGT